MPFCAERIPFAVISCISDSFHLVICMIPESIVRKSYASLPARGFSDLGPAKNMNKQPIFEEKWSNYECFWGLRDHMVRNNLVSKGSKYLLPPPSSVYISKLTICIQLAPTSHKFQHVMLTSHLNECVFLISDKLTYNELSGCSPKNSLWNPTTIALKSPFILIIYIRTLLEVNSYPFSLLWCEYS